MTFKETQDIHRLYLPEWVIMHTETVGLVDEQSGYECMAHALTWTAENLTGRVVDEDIKIEANTDNEKSLWCHVMLFKNNLRGEFKHRDDAERYAAANDLIGYTIVVRNSKQDHDLRAYGVKKL